jgi:hypothetical protein
LGLNELYEASVVEDWRASAAATYEGYNERCWKDKEVVVDDWDRVSKGGESIFKGTEALSKLNSQACSQADRYVEVRNRWTEVGARHREDARNYLLMLVLLPLSVALCFYGGRWIFTGRLRPFWLLHDD